LTSLSRVVFIEPLQCPTANETEIAARAMANKAKALLLKFI
jgi:hypothetical protein